MPDEQEQKELHSLSTENYKLLLATIEKQNQTISSLEQKITDVVSLNQALLSNEQFEPKSSKSKEDEIKKPTFKDLLKRL